MNKLLLQQAGEMPDGVALTITPSGATRTWRELEQHSRQCAAALIARGFEMGDVIAICMENNAQYIEIAFAAQRAGLYFTPVSRSLKARELRHILADSGAKAVFFSSQTAQAVQEASGPGVLQVIVQEASADAAADHAQRPSSPREYEDLLAEAPADVALPDRPMGADFCYSSGTTGLPKGIKRDLFSGAALFEERSEGRLIYRAFGPDTVYLTAAPIHHAAPLRYTLRVLGLGGRAIVMERFDAQAALGLVERYRVTHSLWVPTMFKRLLELPESARRAHDLSSMRYAIHVGAPCPIPVKEAMIGWWGPIIYEYYAGTEVVGRTSLSSEEWLAHKGSVGLPEFGRIHIVGDGGRELGPREIGQVYFSGFTPFEYHNDPQKTREAVNEHGWGTYGDIGYVDDEGYLYLTDRASNMIVSGGVNIYPEETEQLLATHPLVSDVAVIGVPNEDFGEEVKALVILREAEPSSEVARELIDFCRRNLSPIKCPRSVDFVDDLPRTETGKLLKRVLKSKYWGDGAKLIA